MKLPKKLKIGGHIYKIVLEKGNNKLEVRNYGKTMRDKNEIVLDSSLPKNQMVVTLFHEILHALNSQLNETLVDSLGEQLYQVFSDNKLI